MSEEARQREVALDRYYLGIANAVMARANCHGSKVGAVLVLRNRVISTGYNGTPAGFTNCEDGGCVRCRARLDSPDAGGMGLDRCICVHAEQNALLAAARFGIAVEGATLYTVLSPCFGCLKEAFQAGITRLVYQNEYAASYTSELQAQYDALVEHLRRGEPTNFEPLGGVQPALIDRLGQPDPYAELMGKLAGRRAVDEQSRDQV